SYLAGETDKFEIENRVRHKDGSYRWMLARGVAVRDAGGKPIRFVGSGIDITDLKRAEEALRESEEGLRRGNDRRQLAVRGSNIGIWDIDMPDGDFRHGPRNYVNIWERLGYERLDFPPDHETGMAPIHPDDRALVEEAARKYLAGETSKY